MEDLKNQFKMDLIKAYAEFQSKVPAIDLDGVVAFNNKTQYKYATLPNIIKQILPVLRDCGLTFRHTIHQDGTISCIIVHIETGESFEPCELKLPIGTNIKDVGAAITYARRYTLTAALGLITDNDPEPPNNDLAKPILKDESFQAAKARIMKGQKGVLNNCRANFTLTPKQDEELLNLEMQHNL